MISDLQLVKLRRLIGAGRERDFYCWPAWHRKRAEVLRLDNQECQRCKAQGRYTPAVIVHHVKHLKERPDLALSVLDPDTGERQLVSLCRACHESEHPERLADPWQPTKQPISAERWD